MIVVNLPAGTPIDRTEDAVRRIGAWLLDESANPEVESVVSYIGYGGPRIVLAMAPVAAAAHRGFILVNVPVEIGRASCRERVCQYVVISVVAVSKKKKEKRQNTTEN